MPDGQDDDGEQRRVNADAARRLDSRRNGRQRVRQCEDRAWGQGMVLNAPYERPGARVGFRLARAVA